MGVFRGCDLRWLSGVLAWRSRFARLVYGHCGLLDHRTLEREFEGSDCGRHGGLQLRR